MKASHLVTCSIAFILFYEQSWQGGVLKVMKNDDFFSVLAVWVHFPKILGKLRGDLCENCTK